MRISMKSDYALRAMMELAQAYGGRTLQTAEIAARRGIPESYLEQLLTVLRKAGYVTSARGPQGGHTLARHPSKVTAGDVVRAMEGSVVLDCPNSSNGGQLPPNSAIKALWNEVRAAVDATLDRVTIEELARRQSIEDGRTMYYI